MGKIIKPILEFRDMIIEKKITINEIKPPKVVLRRYVQLLKEIPDSRLEGMVDYPLYEILLIAFLAVLGNASSYDEMEVFGNAKVKWLKKFLPLKNGIPSHDTFRRVFSIMDATAFETATVAFLCDNMHAIRKSLKLGKNGLRQICVDGKEQKGTGRKKRDGEIIKNLQTLHIYDASNGICLVSASIEEKTNEIPTAQHFLKALDLKDAIVTFDAMNTQKETIRIIAEKKGHYVGALKKNHENFYKDIEDFFDDKTKEKIRTKGLNFYETTEKAHSQIETRRFYLTTNIKWFDKKDDWKNLKSFICFEKIIYDLKTQKQRIEIRYYISDLKDIEICAQAIRGHWAVENTLHWHLDFSFIEDDNTTADRNAFQNLSLLNKMILSLMKLAQPLNSKKISIRSLRKKFGWETENQIALILNSFDADSIIHAVETANEKK